MVSTEFKKAQIMVQISLLCQGVNAQARNKKKVEELTKELQKLSKQEATT